jgi:hypothetical protein
MKKLLKWVMLVVVGFIGLVAALALFVPDSKDVSPPAANAPPAPVAVPAPTAPKQTTADEARALLERAVLLSKSNISTLHANDPKKTHAHSAAWQALATDVANKLGPTIGSKPLGRCYEAIDSMHAGWRGVIDNNEGWVDRSLQKAMSALPDCNDQIAALAKDK